MSDPGSDPVTDPTDWPTGPAERHRVAASLFAERVRGVTDWSAPAPPEGWAARDVVVHLREWLPGFLSSQVGVQLREAPTGDDESPIIST